MFNTIPKRIIYFPCLISYLNSTIPCNLSFVIVRVAREPCTFKLYGHFWCTLCLVHAQALTCATSVTICETLQLVHSFPLSCQRQFHQSHSINCHPQTNSPIDFTYTLFHKEFGAHSYDSVPRGEVPCILQHQCHS